MASEKVELDSENADRGTVSLRFWEFNGTEFTKLNQANWDSQNLYIDGYSCAFLYNGIPTFVENSFSYGTGTGIGQAWFNQYSWGITSVQKFDFPFEHGVCAYFEGYSYLCFDKWMRNGCRRRYVLYIYCIQVYIIYLVIVIYIIILPVI